MREKHTCFLAAGNLCQTTTLLIACRLGGASAWPPRLYPEEAARDQAPIKGTLSFIFQGSELKLGLNCPGSHPDLRFITALPSASVSPSVICDGCPDDMRYFI